MKLKFINLGIILVSIVLLVPGVTKPIFDLTMKTTVKVKIGEFSTDGLNKSRSILGTVKELYESKKYLVSFLILFFSVVVPFLKGIGLILVLFAKRVDFKRKIFNFINAIGKWSMADVFVVAVFLAYLATSGEGQSKSFEVTILGMVLPVDMSTKIVSNIGPGFYYFLSYCLVSIGSLHLVKYFLDSESKESATL